MREMLNENFGNSLIGSCCYVLRAAIVCMAFVTLTLTGSSAMSEVPEQNRSAEELLGAAERALKSADDTNRVLSGDIDFYEVRTDPTGPNPSPKTVVEHRRFWFDGDSAKVILEGAGKAAKHGRRIVFGINSRYAFQLRQSSESSPFLLVQFGDDPTTRRSILSEIRRLTWAVKAPCSVLPFGDVSFSTAVRNGMRSKIIKIDSVVSPTSIAGLPRFEFGPGLTISNSDKQGAVSKTVGPTYITVDPSVGWRITGEQLPWPHVTEHVSIAYEDRLPQCNSFRVTDHLILPAAPEFRDDLSFNVHIKSRVPISGTEFTLTSFGLTEVAGPNTRRAAQFSWVGVGFALAGVALFLIFWLRRRQRGGVKAGQNG